MARKKTFSVATSVRSKLRLFLSIDIVGSTAFKQREKISEDSKNRLDWLSHFLAFYQEVGAEYQEAWEKLRPLIGSEISATPPRFWKGAGDEQIYIREVKHKSDVLCGVLACLSVLQSQREKFALAKIPLDIKGTAWLAGFPINNSEIAISDKVNWKALSDDNWLANQKQLARISQNGKNNGNDIQIDFIGPSIDLGFRLCALSSPRMLVISADLALMIARSWSALSTPKKKQLEKTVCDLKVAYHGKVSLKGILGGSKLSSNLDRCRA